MDFQTNHTTTGSLLSVGEFEAIRLICLQINRHEQLFHFHFEKQLFEISKHFL